MTYNPEPKYEHGDQLKVGILIANLGTPDAPTAKALRPYLRQFLSDARIVEIPRIIWWFILNGIILVIRPKKSAKKYASVWTKEGSPLLAHAQKQALLLRGFLGQKIKSPFAVELGMSYGNPSMASAIAKLKAQHCDRILVFPLYPQYAASSTASALDAVWRVLLKTRNVPAIRTIKHYHDHPAYISALAKSVLEHWRINGKPSKLVMSFHGVPKFHLLKGDMYHCECHKTGRLLAEALALNKDEYLIAFQSRFGKQEWLKPYLAGTLEALGKANTKRVDVICPGFSSDCLETLEEIAIEGKHIFQSNGGGDYEYIPSLNENEAWIHAMTAIAMENLQGWVSAEWDDNQAKKEAEMTKSRAQSLVNNQ
ncbi:MAG: ferrochelatase [Methylotenera sp.]|nr:ferrochelatase [Methylotenera sp.]MDO9232850.1 ferrochelatase [Methylotenera sp.]MDO9388907.1 ferrochelatase [Methylotenera sp.]MDP2102903.1 ferrochelatase [Methylotenera sp.]MDP2281370.1 ferrochelatase [Methylotenera sp.]